MEALKLLELISPFFIVVSDTLEVKSTGSLIQKSQGRSIEGMSFFDVFESQMAMTNAFQEAKEKGRSGLWFFKTKDGRQSFRTTAHRSENNDYLLLNSPVVNAIFPIENYNISLQDIPAHDSLFELVFFQQASLNALDDALKLNTQLELKNKALKSSSERLADLNGELTSMLSAVHHRVKNNLTLMSGIMEIKKSREENQFAAMIIHDLQSRLHAMAKVHETMYKSGVYNKVNVRLFVEQLTKSITQQPGHDHPIRLALDVQDVLLDSSKSIYLGLIMNELLNNCKRHAFTHISDPTISISVYSTRDLLFITVHDNGVGLTSLPDKVGIGLTVVDMLARQMKGFYTLTYNEGTEVRIQIPLE